MANTSFQTPEPPVELLPTHLAAVKDDVEKLSQLVAEKAPLEDPSTNETPLHAAAKMGSLDALKWLMRNKTVQIDTKGSGGYTAAHYAAVYGHFDCLKLLLTYPGLGKDLAALSEGNGHTVLSLATLQGDVNMVSWLLENFPDTAHIPNSNGDQAVHFAAAEGQLDILKMLVDKFGVEIVTRRDHRSTNPVFFAAQQGKLNVLDYLINDLGQDPLAKDKDEMTTVHAATQNQMAPTVKWLIEKLGPKYILEKTVDGATPLHMAAASGNIDILKFLLDRLENKEDVNVTDAINATPAHDAAEYGRMKAMLLLLKYGADISITDTESKTPYQLAVQQDHTEVAAMLADYRDNGPSALQSYEKTRPRPSRSDDKRQPRTSQQEAEELSSVIEKTTEALDTYKEKQLKRQESLTMLGVTDDEDDHKKKRKKSKSHGIHEMSPQRTDEEDNIEHALGPKGDIYAVPKPNRQKAKGGGKSRHNHEINEFLNETMSHHSHNRGHHYRGGSYDEDHPYAGGMVNHETASNYSRPSRVKQYRDTDSDISGLTGRSDYLYDGRYPGFYPPGYNPMYPPSLPMAKGGKKPKKPGSVSSKGSQPSSAMYPGQGPMGMQYGYNQPMYYGYPQMYPAGYHGGMMPMHPQAMMGPGGPRPMFMAHPMQLQRLRHQQQQQQSRRRSLTDKKKVRKISKESHPSPRKPQPDQDIGYGPALETTDSGNLLHSKPEDVFQPPAPPISGMGGAGKMEAASEVLKFDSNFIMAKPGETNEIRHHAGTALNPASATKKPYDGRYDEYIMTDSEEEYETDEYHRVGFAAEVACILAIGCVAGLKGLSKMRKGKPGLPAPAKSGSEKPSLSSAWDMSYEEVEGGGKKKKKGRKSRRNSISDVELDMSPEAFAGHEDTKTTWDKSNKKNKKKDKEEKLKPPTDPEEPQSELLTEELRKQTYQSVSKALGEKILYDTIGARHSSMMNLGPSNMGSRMSLNVSSADEGGDDDDFDDAISIMDGRPVGATKRKHHVPDPISVDNAGDTNQLLSDNEKSKKKKKDKKSKEGKEKKSKKDKKAKKSTSDNNQDNAEVIENREAIEGSADVEVSAEEAIEEPASPVESTSKEASFQDKANNDKEEELKREKKEQERKERELRDKEKKEKQQREKEQKEREKKDKGAEEKERREKERQLKEQKKKEERERKEQEKQEREAKEKERKEKEKKEKEERDKEKKERDQERKERERKEKEEKKEREQERKEKERKEKEQREKEKKEREQEKKEMERRAKEQREKEKREKEEERREKERLEREQREKERKEREEKLEKEREEREREKREEEKAKAVSVPARSAPPPPSGLRREDKVRSEIEEGDNEAREVENKVYMFDTESESDEEPDVSLMRKPSPVEPRRAPVARQAPPPPATKKETPPPVDDIQTTIMDMTADLNAFLETPTQPAPPKKTVQPPVDPDVGIAVDQTSIDIFGGEDALAELNNALFQLNNIQSGQFFNF